MVPLRYAAMQLYKLGPPSGSVLIPCSCFAVPAVLWALGLMTVNHKSRATDPGPWIRVANFLLIGLACYYLAAKQLVRTPYEIRVEGGRIHFACCNLAVGPPAGREEAPDARVARPSRPARQVPSGVSR